MTPAEWDCLERYLRTLGDEAALRDWDLRLVRDEWCEDDCEASVTRTEYRRVASFRVSREFRTMERKDQRWSLAHELVHCHLGHARDLIRIDALRLMGMEVHALLDASHNRALEYAVDDISGALAKHLPLIEWPSDAKA